ncbi:DNA polymerase delta subunit 4 [Periophthalmus magnuspinnatus]|uniref:DNA polymerase delta subunit 4 n=1 Tax=Periophthalmus magnuspinnatus TaxID=409849 RepID=UPI00145A4B9D|nr:DNA polymerase delta subunit 4 [Periophthalmus magnuspinnatus]XP_033822368.1 DNA polymerase delta subunit 4 [Periophthalmus magnuspinnatus]
MTTKRRLITDSYRVVKRERRGGKRERSPTPPPTPEQIESAARQEDLQKLKQFDLDWRFGPCTGISRLQRWERAQLHGLSPPQEIKELLLQSAQDVELTDSLWRDYPL